MQAFLFRLTRENISASLRGKKLRNKINNFNCSRPLSRDNGGMDKNPTLWCRSSCCSDSPYVLQLKECARLEMQKCSCVPASDIWISCMQLSKQKITVYGFYNLRKCCLGCSTKNKRQAQCHSLIQTHSFPKRISVIAKAHKQQPLPFNKPAQQTIFSVSSSSQLNNQQNRSVIKKPSVQP